MAPFRAAHDTSVFHSILPDALVAGHRLDGVAETGAVQAYLVDGGDCQGEGVVGVRGGGVGSIQDLCMCSVGAQPEMLAG